MKGTVQVAIAVWVSVLSLDTAAFGQLQGRVSTSDPLDCFTFVSRQTQGGVDNPDQAVEQDSWSRLMSCRDRVPVLAALDPCWALIMEARPLIERAAALYEEDRAQGRQAAQRGESRRRPTPFDDAQPLRQRAGQLTLQAMQCAEEVRANIASTRRPPAPPNLVATARVAANAIIEGRGD